MTLVAMMYACFGSVLMFDMNLQLALIVYGTSIFVASTSGTNCHWQLSPFHLLPDKHSAQPILAVLRVCTTELGTPACTQAYTCPEFDTCGHSNWRSLRTL